MLVNRQNKTVRPDTHIPENEPTLSASGFLLQRKFAKLSRAAVEVIRNNMSARQSDLRLYLDAIPDPSKVCGSTFMSSYLVTNSLCKPDPPPGCIMVFLKHFDTSKQTLLGAGKAYVPRNSKVADLYPIVCERMRWAPGTPIKLYEVCLSLTHVTFALPDHVMRRK